MRKPPNILFISATFISFLVGFLTFALAPTNTAFALNCGISDTSVEAGTDIHIAYQYTSAGLTIFMWDGSTHRYDIGTTRVSDDVQWASLRVPSTATPGRYAVFIEVFGNILCPAATADDRVEITAGSGGGPTSLGTIGVPGGVPNPPDSTAYVARIIKNGLSLLVIIAFLAALLWTIFAGFRFVTSGGDEKSISQAWSSIYWGIIGMIVVVASYAIVKLVETFFNVSIISGGLILP